MFRIDYLLASLQRMVNQQSIDLRVDPPASQSGVTGMASTLRSPNKCRSDPTDGPSPAKQSKKDAPPRSPTPSDVEPSSDIEVTPHQAESATMSTAPVPRQRQQQPQRKGQCQGQSHHRQSHDFVLVSQNTVFLNIPNNRYSVRSTRRRAPERHAEPLVADWGVNRDGSGSVGHGSWVKWVTIFGWVTWVIAHS